MAMLWSRERQETTRTGYHKVAILLLTLPLDYQLALQMLLAALEEYNCITQMTPKFE
jgi:hypothetical protein